MFESTDDFNLDEEFLNDAFGVAGAAPEVNTNKRNSGDFSDASSKKLRIEQTTRAEAPPNVPFRNQLNRSKPRDILDILQNANKKPQSPQSLGPPGNRERNFKVVKRKFPGPAGLLPEQRQAHFLSTEECNVKENISVNEDTVCSQVSSDAFKSGPWQQMLTDFYIKNAPKSLPEKYTISWLKAQATAKQLIGKKTPFLAVMIHSIDCTSKNPIAVLKDDTGEIYGAIHHEVWDEYGQLLCCGSVVVLKQVGVLTTPKRHYLNITSNNLVTIYNGPETEQRASDAPASAAVKTTRVNYMTSDDFINSIDNLRKKYESRQVTLPKSADNPFLKQIRRPSVRANTSLSPDVISGTHNKKFSLLPRKAAGKFNFNPVLSNTNSKNVFASSANCSLSDLDISIDDNKNEAMENVLDGIDTDSLFEEF